MFKWVKRLFKQKQEDKTSNINGLYTARLEDVKHINDAIPELESKLDDLKDRLDKIPPIPELTDYAKKNEANTFTNQNTFENHSEAIVVKGNANRVIAFKDNANNNALVVGKTHANDAIIKANVLTISNDNSVVGFDAEKTEIKYKENSIRLNNDGAVFNIDGVTGNIDSNQFKLANYNPEHEDSVVTKKYVDKTGNTLKYVNQYIIHNVDMMLRKINDNLFQYQCIQDFEGNDNKHTLTEPILDFRTKFTCTFNIGGVDLAIIKYVEPGNAFEIDLRDFTVMVSKVHSSHTTFPTFIRNSDFYVRYQIEKI